MTFPKQAIYLAAKAEMASYLCTLPAHPLTGIGNLCFSVVCMKRSYSLCAGVIVQLLFALVYEPLFSILMSVCALCLCLLCTNYTRIPSFGYRSQNVCQ